MTQSNRMVRLRVVLLALVALTGPAAAQVEENYIPAGLRPGLLLTEKRLRLLRRERERQSPRWQQFDKLVTGSARMPEPGFALALYYQVSQKAEFGKRAVEWALTAGDVRQSALVLDWCRPVMTGEQAAALTARLEHSLEGPPQTNGVPEARARTFAAVAIADHNTKLAGAELRRVCVQWFRGNLVPGLSKGRAVPRSDLYGLFELLHAVRDNLAIDLRESARGYFSQLALAGLLSYYPAPLAEPENDYRIPATVTGEPDTQLAILARAADLAMVGYDSNSVDEQYVQGWLMHDHFVMTAPFAAPYEFLWANPYLPGLSYHSAPLEIYDSSAGRIFVRSSWDDDAMWVGYFDGQLQVFADGRPKAVRGKDLLRIGNTAVAPAAPPASFEIEAPLTKILLVGLTLGRSYRIDAARKQGGEKQAGPGGIIEMTFEEGYSGHIRVREAQPAK